MGEQFVPPRTPDHLDDVPAGTAEHGFEFLDDLAVATHRTIETLQVAVDDEDEVVELLARRQRKRTECFGFVALTVTEIRPHAAGAGVVELAVEQVAVEARLIDGGDGAEAHRHRGELPELGHESRVRVTGEAATAPAEFAAEVIEVVFCESSLEERARVHTGCGVALEVDVVAGRAVVLAAEEVVEADLVEAGRTGERGEVAADSVGRHVGAHHHDRGVPADEGADAAFDVFVAGEPRLHLARNGVDVRRGHRGRERHLALAGSFEQSGQQVARADLAVHVDHRIERVEPLLGFTRVGVGKLMYGTVEEHERQSRRVTRGYGGLRARGAPR